MSRGHSESTMLSQPGSVLSYMVLVTLKSHETAQDLGPHLGYVELGAMLLLGLFLRGLNCHL